MANDEHDSVNCWVFTLTPISEEEAKNIANDLFHGKDLLKPRVKKVSYRHSNFLFDKIKEIGDKVLKFNKQITIRGVFHKLPQPTPNQTRFLKHHLLLPLLNPNNITIQREIGEDFVTTPGGSHTLIDESQPTESKSESKEEMIVTPQLTSAEVTNNIALLKDIGFISNYSIKGAFVILNEPIGYAYGDVIVNRNGFRHCPLHGKEQNITRLCSHEVSLILNSLNC